MTNTNPLPLSPFTLRHLTDLITEAKNNIAWRIATAHERGDDLGRLDTWTTDRLHEQAEQLLELHRARSIRLRQEA